MPRQIRSCSLRPSSPSQRLQKARALTWLSGLALSAALLPSLQAQELYRVVGPDGRITFSDRAPVNGASKSADRKDAGNASQNTAHAQLPYELREAAKRYPVMLYTTKDCSPCSEARSHLQNRGIPFAERTVETESDAASFKKISAQDGLPFATVGNQHLKGFNADSWNQYLTAAGYPKQSQLPAQYQAQPPKPLAAPVAQPQATQAATQPTASETARPAVAPRPAAPGAPTADNPAGLRF